MKRMWWYGAMVLVWLVPSSGAMALVTSQGIGGIRLVSMTEGSNSSSLVGIEGKWNLLWDLIPVWPIAFGTYVSWSQVRTNDSVQTIRGWDVGVLGEYWIPIRAASLQPFVQGGLPLTSSMHHSGGLVDFSDNVSGFFIGAGMRFMIFFRLGLIFEVTHEWRSESDLYGKSNIEGTSLLFGSQFGI